MSDVPFHSRFKGGFYFTVNRYDCPSCLLAVRVRVTRKKAKCTQCGFEWEQIPKRDEEGEIVKNHQNPFDPIEHGEW